MEFPNGWNTESGIVLWMPDTSVTIAATVTEESQLNQKFKDEIDGLNLNDSISKVLKHKLACHIKTYKRKFLPYEARNQLYTELSCIDSVIEKQAVFDYLVDRLLFHEYEGDKLISIMGYHWDSGVEYDHFQYDKSGNLVYFSRESIGSIREEYYFEYNIHQQVSKVTRCYSSAGNTDEGSYRYEDQEITMYGYNAAGKINSRSQFWDGAWSTCHVDLDGRN